MTLAVTGQKLINTYNDGRSRSYRKIVNDRNNAIYTIADRIAGSQKKRRLLTKEKRAQLQEHAKFLYEIGHQVSPQDIAESAVKAGFVYVITNPAYPQHVKVGRAFDVDDRLRKYQTGCPYRGYSVYDSVYFEDCLSAERNIHAGLDCLRQTGEWYRLTARQAMSVIKQYKETFPCGAN